MPDILIGIFIGLAIILVPLHLWMYKIRKELNGPNLAAKCTRAERDPYFNREYARPKKTKAKTIRGLRLVRDFHP